MNSRDLKMHGIWALAMSGAFVVGTQLTTTKTDGPGDPALSQRESSSFSSTSGAHSGSLESATSTRTGNSQGKENSSVLADLFNNASLTNGGLERLATEAFNDPNPVKRRLAFSKLLESMTPENAALIRDQLITLGSGGQEWRDFNYAWGAMAGQDAFNAAMLGDKRDLESLMTGWAAADPTAAKAMLANLPEGLQDQKTRLEASIVSGLADRDRNEAASYVATLVAEGRQDAHRLMDIVAGEVLRKDGPEGAAAWTEGLPNGPLKGAAMNEIANRFARTDPEAASAWIEKYAREDFAARAVAEVGQRWARQDPLTAVNWLNQLPEGQGQKSGLNSAFGDWEDKDPVAAGEYLLSMPNSAKRDSAISGFASGYAWQDPQTAIAWAEDIGDPNLRTQSLTNAGQAYFRRDPEGAKTWLATTDLPADVQQAILKPPSRRR